MFERRQSRSGFGAAFTLFELIYYATARDIRKAHGNAIISILINILQTLMLVLIFYLMFTILGLRGAGIRGDFLLYVMSGVFLFMTHTKSVGAIVGSDGPSSPMMKHAPMNTIIAICSSALGALYIQVLSAVTVLFLYSAIVTPIEIYDPVGAFGMLLLSWFSGVAVGMVFLAIKPWFPSFTQIGSQLYQRANMVASGKMFVANTMPGYMLVMFDWNPLFHCIDQARGFAFKNYFPHFSSVEYPLKVSIALIMIGLMGEFYTRRRASLSWDAKR